MVCFFILHMTPVQMSFFTALVVPFCVSRTPFVLPTHLQFKFVDLQSPSSLADMTLYHVWMRVAS